MESPEIPPVAPEEEAPENKQAHGPVARTMRFLWQTLIELLETILPAILIALVINLFLAQATVVQGQSMEPTLHNNQRVIMEKVSYHFHGPRRGDVVIVSIPGQDEPLIKRVVALPGETVEVREGHVFINGDPLEEPWAVHMGGPSMPPTYIPPLHVFVLGDNRGHSNDSRSFGPVMVDQIIGRAWVTYWPPEMVGTVH